MYFLIFLAFGFQVALSTRTSLRLDIVGGEKAEHKLFKYQTSVEIFKIHRCGGTLIAKDIVITAAHCINDIHHNHLEVRIGSRTRQFGGQLHRVAKVIPHPAFTTNQFESDVAILQLETHVKLSRNIGILPLSDVEPETNTIATISGWGRIKEGGRLSKNLRFAKIPILNRSYCQHQNPIFSKKMICAGKIEGGVDACNIDSGGPLVANNKLVGIISWGIGCARPGLAGFYTNVAQFKPWIERTIFSLNVIKTN